MPKIISKKYLLKKVNKNPIVISQHDIKEFIIERNKGFDTKIIFDNITDLLRFANARLLTNYKFIRIECGNKKMQFLIEQSSFEVVVLFVKQQLQIPNT